MVREFGERAFSRHCLLGDFTIPASVTKLGEWVYYNTSMTNLIVHENVTEIGNYCFNWNKSLQTVNIKTVHINGTNLFASCSKLESVVLPNITTIPNSMFSDCAGKADGKPTGLRNFIIPETVTNIGPKCFSGCVYLGDITCLPTTAPTLGTDVFGNSSANYTGSEAPSKNLHVPSKSTGYNSGDWKNILLDKVGFTLNSF